MTHRRSAVAAAIVTTVLFSAGTCSVAATGASSSPAVPAAQNAATALPAESIYQLDAPLTDQRGRQTSLGSLRGQPVLITMFYSSCQGVCPMLAFTMRRMDQALTPAQRGRLRLSMISFDPERDTPQALSEFGRLNHLDDTRWLLARAPDAKVREIAAVLNIRYRPLPNGVFSHSAVILLLDADGVIRARTETLKELDPQFMQALRALL